VPALELLARLAAPLTKHQVGVLVLSPTRELAGQTAAVLREFLSDLPSPHQITAQLFIGGGKVERDLVRWREQGGQILVSTPGRLADLLGRGPDLVAGLRSLELLVLDEADRLLSLGFEAALNTILGLCPKQRRTGLFSATQTSAVESLVRAGLRNPAVVAVRDKQTSTAGPQQRTPASLENFYMVCEPRQKFSTLVEFLRAKAQGKVMVFATTCACVDYFSVLLQHFLPDTKIFSIHGKIKKKRHKIFSLFRSAASGLLLCTDVMARGVDIPDLQWVVQLDPPTNAESFVHRCGRTARQGSRGTALLLLTPSQEAYIDFLQLNQDVRLGRLEPPEPPGPDLLAGTRQLLRQDRDTLDRATRAFVSFVQSYAKHECNLILRLKDLDLGGIASSYGLLKLPKMPEIRRSRIENFEEATVDLNSIAYRDAGKEAGRQEKLAVYRETGQWPGAREKKKDSVAWSQKLEVLNKRREKKLRKLEKRKASENSSVVEEESDEEDDFMADYKKMKKLKKGKLSQSEFDKAIDLDKIETENG